MRLSAIRTQHGEKRLSPSIYFIEINVHLQALHPTNHENWFVGCLFCVLWFHFIEYAPYNSSFGSHILLSTMNPISDHSKNLRWEFI